MTEIPNGVPAGFVHPPVAKDGSPREAQPTTVPTVEQTMAAGVPSPTQSAAGDELRVVAGWTIPPDDAPVRLETAPRPELDWTRDWQGRPRILPDPAWAAETVAAWADGRANDQGEVPYTRVTTYAEALQDAAALTRWKMRRVLLGASRRPDYVTGAAALTAEDRDREQLDDLAEKCLEAAGPNAADVGTALHGFTERIDRGEDVGVVPEEYRADLDAYRRVVGHLRFVERECRTVCDVLEVAGTPDGLAFCDVPDPDGVVDDLRIVDTKTGRVDYSAGKFATQLAIYAHSVLYHPGTGERTTYADRHGAAVNLRWGVVVHMPAGAGTAELLWIKLEHGWAGALEAGRVRDWRTEATARNLLVPVFARPPRPAPADGSCRGRLGSGKPCTYRAKRIDGQQTQWCGRHQDQQDGLERWLAENPDADPASGEEERPSMEPVQPATGGAVPTQEESRAAVDAALSGALGVGVHTRWDAIDAAEEARAAALAQPATVEGIREHVAPRTQQEAGTLRAAQEAAPMISREEWDEDVRAAALEAGEEPAPLPGERCPTMDLVAELEDGTPPPARELRVAGIPVVEDPAVPPGAVVVGTYALNPATEVNGNPRPVAGLRSPDDAHSARRLAVDTAVRQMAAARSESDLVTIYSQHRHVWTPELTALAGQRSREIQAEQARAKPQAALLSAVLTAPDTAVLMQLHRMYGAGGLWDAGVDAAASTRWRQLEQAAQLDT